MTALKAPGPDFRTGPAISRTFRMLRRQAIPDALLCIATFVPPSLMLLLLNALPSAQRTVIHIGTSFLHVYPASFVELPVLLGSFALVPLGSARHQHGTDRHGVQLKEECSFLKKRTKRLLFLRPRQEWCLRR